MKSVQINSSSLVTGDDLADGLLDLALALSREQRVEVAELPVIDRFGDVQCARMLVGAGIPVMTVTVEHDGTPELRDPDALGALRSRAAGLEQGWMVPQN